MSVIESADEYRRGEDLGVFLWRLERTLQMGFKKRLADRIASMQIDLHELEGLLSSGCPRRTAYRILRP